MNCDNGQKIKYDLLTEGQYKQFLVKLVNYARLSYNNLTFKLRFSSDIPNGNFS
jgi:hypothetical protein